MKVILFAGSWLGEQMVNWLVAEGHDVCVIISSSGDRATRAARAAGCKLVVKENKLPLIGHDIPWEPDMIVSAHSFRIVPDWLLDRCRGVSIGYHPSLLPAFKGRHAIQDCLRAGVRMTGGTVYHLGQEIDGGRIMRVSGRQLQERVQIIPGESPAQIWQRALCPLGFKLLKQTLR